MTQAVSERSAVDATDVRHNRKQGRRGSPSCANFVRCRAEAPRRDRAARSSRGASPPPHAPPLAMPPFAILGGNFVRSENVLSYRTRFAPVSSDLCTAEDPEMARMLGMVMIGGLAVPDAAALISVRGTAAGHRRFPSGSWAVRKMVDGRACTVVTDFPLPRGLCSRGLCRHRLPEACTLRRRMGCAPAADMPARARAAATARRRTRW